MDLDGSSDGPPDSVRISKIIGCITHPGAKSFLRSLVDFGGLWQTLEEFWMSFGGVVGEFDRVL